MFGVVLEQLEVVMSVIKKFYGDDKVKVFLGDVVRFVVLVILSESGVGEEDLGDFENVLIYLDDGKCFGVLLVKLDGWW